MNAAADGVRPSARRARKPAQETEPPYAPGRMSPRLDWLSLQFVIAARSAHSEILDLGCGDGLASAAALDRGAHVLAVDTDPVLLERLRERVPGAQHPRLRTGVGTLPSLDFKGPRFAAVHMARVLHLLDGDATECTFRKCFRWLYPQGRLYVSTLTPMGDFWRPVRSEFARQVRAGRRWPGYIPTLARFLGATTAVHLFDERILRRELTAVGFIIEEARWYALPWDGAQVCCAVIARCGC